LGDVGIEVLDPLVVDEILFSTEAGILVGEVDFLLDVRVQESVLRLCFEQQVVFPLIGSIHDFGIVTV